MSIGNFGLSFVIIPNPRKYTQHNPIPNREKISKGLNTEILCQKSHDIEVFIIKYGNPIVRGSLIVRSLGDSKKIHIISISAYKSQANHAFCQKVLINDHWSKTGLNGPRPDLMESVAQLIFQILDWFNKNIWHFWISDSTNATTATTWLRNICLAYPDLYHVNHNIWFITGELVYLTCSKMYFLVV